MRTSNGDSVSGTKNSPTNDAKYRNIISTLPQEDAWHPSTKIHQYQGFWCATNSLVGIMSAQHHFQARPTDIITCSLPKSGTTWLKALCFSIARRTQFNNSSENPLLTHLPHELVPFLEYTDHEGHIRDPNDLPLWATHVPYASLPRSIIESNCKIVYICRNPKDVFVSFWHFTARIRGTPAEEFPIELALKKFCDGVSGYGPFWSHALGYWKASLEFPDRIMFIQYEDLQVHTHSCVKKLAEFMGYPFTKEEEEEGLVQKIVDLCSFESLSNLEVNKSKNHGTKLPIKIENSSFFRKGKIGDWENYLTAEMAAQIDKIIADKFNGSGLSFSMPTV